MNRYNFPSPKLSFDEEGDVTNNAWVFRGVRDSAFKLEPSIEREALDGDPGWASLEVKVADEFKVRAHMHIGQELIPRDELSWLALMQHYGIPTRLLDFTLSPFVALYFAVRNAEKKNKSARIWAMDSTQINRRFLSIRARAHMKQQERSSQKASAHRGSLNPDDAATERDILRNDALFLRHAAEETLVATGAFRGELNRRGCVCMALPPYFNPRLASQQGVFLFNSVEKLTFEESMQKMMGAGGDWRRTFDLPQRLFRETEERLFQMNIHEQSLFPDVGGLAGLIRQKIRLHWK